MKDETLIIVLGIGVVLLVIVSKVQSTVQSGENTVTNILNSPEQFIESAATGIGTVFVNLENWLLGNSATSGSQPGGG